MSNRSEWISLSTIHISSRWKQRKGQHEKKEAPTCVPSPQVSEASEVISELHKQVAKYRKADAAMKLKRAQNRSATNPVEKSARKAAAG